jgi:hypothetical protein
MIKMRIRVRIQKNVGPLGPEMEPVPVTGRSGPVPVWISDRPLPVDRPATGRPVVTARPAGYR